MEGKQQFLDKDGLVLYHKKLKTDIKTDIDNEINSHTAGFISYTDDTDFEELEEV